MTDFKNIILLVMCINVVMYVLNATYGITIADDPISKIMDTTELAEGNIKFNETLQGKVKDLGANKGIMSEITEFFTDGLGLIFDFIKIMFNLLTAPIAFFTVGLHVTMRILIGVPLFISYFVAIITVIRGAS